MPRHGRRGRNQVIRIEHTRDGKINILIRGVREDLPPKGEALVIKPRTEYERPHLERIEHDRKSH